MFLRKRFRHNHQFIWDSKHQDACINIPSQFSRDELLPFIACTTNQKPSIYDILDFPVTHFDFLTYDTQSINKSLELFPPVRLYNTYLSQTFASDTTSEISLQTMPSTSNEFVNTHSFGNPPPNLDPRLSPPSNSLPPSNNLITTQTTNSHSPLQYITPSNTPPPTNNNTITIQPTTSQIHRPIPPIPISFSYVITTQPQSHSSNTPFPPTLSSIQNHTFPLPTSQNPTQTSNLPPTSTSYDSYASLNPSFHNFPNFSFEPPNLPPNPCTPLQISTNLFFYSHFSTSFACFTNNSFSSFCCSLRS